MSSQSPQPVPLLWEMVIATIVGVVVGLIADNIIIGSCAGIGVGVVLSVIKTVRAERGGKR